MLKQTELLRARILGGSEVPVEIAVALPLQGHHGEEQRQLFLRIEGQLLRTRPFGWRRLPGLPSEARRA